MISIKPEVPIKICVTEKIKRQVLKAENRNSFIDHVHNKIERKIVVTVKLTSVLLI